MSAISIRLSIFSGLPDPQYVVSAEEEDELLLLLEGSIVDQEPNHKEWREPPALGYRGFDLDVFEVDGPSALVGRYKVYDGAVRVGVQPRTTYYADRTGIEEWLLDDARRRGFGELIQRARSGPL